MAKKLIIVESPTKTKTLKQFLGNDYVIEASMGHVRDLPKTQLGVDVENQFAPHYVTIRDRKDVIAKLKKAVASAETVYLASDPDREGEAIAWHIQQLLKLDKAKRIQFNEITKNAVLKALEEPGDVNLTKVDAQQARRILDRLVGYKISPLLWKKVRRNLSAGRVQSVAVRLIVDREREIEAFVPEEYWSITAALSKLQDEMTFEAKLILHEGKKLPIPNEESSNKILEELKGSDYKVSEIKKKQQRRNPAPPFITSTLQQDASRKLGFSAKRTMLIAQQLYEGINLGSEGSTGLITYMRTDSTRISDEALSEARDMILSAYGSDYLPAKPRFFKSRKGAQGAHEAIRPTSCLRRPDEIKSYLSPEQYKLYNLIWQRFVASQMEPIVLNVVTVDIAAGNYTFRATGSTVKFPGFSILYHEGKDNSDEEDEEKCPLPELSENDLLKLHELVPKQHFTEAPPRYNEATLVKALEEKGIGRPSTYAQIISTIQDREYVELETKQFKPTDLGIKVTDLLIKFFPDILDAKFTADVETKLDDIEEGDRQWVDVLTEFYGPFDKELTVASEDKERVELKPEVTEEICPNCGANMVVKSGRFGKFLACPNYPECKTTMPLVKKLDTPCPKPGCDGEVVEKRSRKGKIFYGCSRWPECDFVTWYKPTKKICETCGYPMGEHRWKGRVWLKCTNKDCETNLEGDKSKENTKESSEGEAASAEESTKD